MGNGPNTVSESMVSNTELSELLGPHRVPGRQLSEFLSAYDLCAEASSPSFVAELTKSGRKTEAKDVLKTESAWSSRLRWQEELFSISTFDPCVSATEPSPSVRGRRLVKVLERVSFGADFGQFSVSLQPCLAESDQKLTKNRPKSRRLARCSVGVCRLKTVTVCGWN